MENKKFELVKEDTITVDGFKLYRIRALKDFFVIKEGELGGYVEAENNLSHEGYCWIYDNAKVYDGAQAKVTPGLLTTLLSISIAKFLALLV